MAESRESMEFWTHTARWGNSPAHAWLRAFTLSCCKAILVEFSLLIALHAFLCVSVVFRNHWRIKSCMQHKTLATCQWATVLCYDLMSGVSSDRRQISYGAAFGCPCLPVFQGVVSSKILLTICAWAQVRKPTEFKHISKSRKRK